MIEAWHSTLEFELRRIEHFATKATARAKVAAWIEQYNTTRRHSALGMRSPGPSGGSGRHTAICVQERARLRWSAQLDEAGFVSGDDQLGAVAGAELG